MKEKVVTLDVLEYLATKKQLAKPVYYQFTTDAVDYIPQDNFERRMIHAELVIQSTLIMSDITTLYNIAHVIYENSFSDYKDEMNNKNFVLMFEKYSVPAWKNYYQFKDAKLIPQKIKMTEITTNTEIITIESLTEQLKNALLS